MAYPIFLSVCDIVQAILSCIHLNGMSPSNHHSFVLFTQYSEFLYCIRDTAVDIVAAVVWLVWGIDDFTQKSNLQSFRFTHEFWA